MIRLHSARASRAAAFVLALGGTVVPEVHAAPGVDPAVERIRAADLGAHIATLASDAFEGREPGTPGERRTTDYLTSTFRRLGVAPANGRSYLQRVPLVEVTRRGEARFRIERQGQAFDLAPRDEFVANAGHPARAVRVRHAPIVFAGYGIQAPEYGWDDYAGVDVRGAVVVVLRGEPTSDDPSFFRGRALTLHGYNKADLAGRLGARAVVTVHTEASAGYPWSLVSGGGGGQSQMFLDGTDSGRQPALSVQISEAAARRLLAAASLTFEDLLARAGQRGFTAVDTGLRADLSWRGRSRSVTSHNVVAHIAGRGAPAECVVYTAHWDHVGRNRSLEGDQIFNGAVDNATGTAALIALADAFRALPAPPRRSVYFVATTAEEKGLRGAEYYAAHPLCPLARTVAVLNLDALFPFAAWTHMTSVGFGLSALEDRLVEAAADFGRTIQPDTTPELGAFYRADSYPFVKRGVPALFAVGNPGPEEPEDSEANRRLLRYGQQQYHRPSDEYDAATWDLRGVEGDVRVYFELGRRLAEGTDFPNWRPETEFRRLRDAMRPE